MTVRDEEAAKKISQVIDNLKENLAREPHIVNDFIANKRKQSAQAISV